jgi:hypothetical protein
MLSRGENFEAKVIELLRWAVQLGSTKGSYKEAIKLLQPGDHYLKNHRTHRRLNHGLQVHRGELKS